MLIVLRLTPLDAWSQAPSWSPDGSLIAYITGEEGNGKWNMFLVDPSGSNRHKLYWPAYPGAPGIWSFDSQKMAFLIQDNDEEIAIIRKDGAGFLQLTRNDAGDWDPAWEPR